MAHKWTYCLGNPPYNADFEMDGNNKSYAKPVYNDFMDAAFTIADKVEFIHPGRFLFNAGGTSKEWNAKMLTDSHFKILAFEPESGYVFPNTDIQGGIAISYHDDNKNFKPIGVFTAFPELNSVLEKVKRSPDYIPFSTVILNRGAYRFSKLAYVEHSNELKALSDSRIGSSVFEKMPDMFTENIPSGSKQYVRYLGLLHGNRVYRWIRLDYQKVPDSFYCYKVFIPKANGSGAINNNSSTQLIGEPVLGHPMVGATETFLSVGSFETKSAAENCLKYIKSKFARALLGVLKITQDNTSDKWKYGK